MAMAAAMKTGNWQRKPALAIASQRKLAKACSQPAGEN